jgi:hypothetical protein
MDQHKQDICFTVYCSDNSDLLSVSLFEGFLEWGISIGKSVNGVPLVIISPKLFPFLLFLSYIKFICKKTSLLSCE